MAYSSGVFSRLYDWTDDRDASVPITASRFDAEMDGMATALSTCLLKDGTQTVTANIPFSGFRLTGIGVATARTDAARADQLQDGLVQFATATGTDTYAATLTPAITAYANGQSFRIKFTNGNTGAATLNVNSVGVVDLQKRNGTALVSGDIPANSIFEVTYNSTGPKFIIDREVVAGQPLDTDLTTIAALSVTRGGLMYGTSAPAWGVLAVGAANTVPVSDGTDFAWGQIPNAAVADNTFAGAKTVIASDTTRGTVEFAVQSEMEAASSDLLVPTPGRMHYHPGVAKCWGQVTGGASPSLITSYNITSIADTATGRLTVTIANDMGSADYCVLMSILGDGGTQRNGCSYRSLATGSFELNSHTEASALQEVLGYSWAVYGDMA